MNDSKNRILKDCDNHYTENQLFDIFGMDEGETKVCMNCSNHRMEGGIITCKYILEGMKEEEDN